MLSRLGKSDLQIPLINVETIPSCCEIGLGFDLQLDLCKLFWLNRLKLQYFYPLNSLFKISSFIFLFLIKTILIPKDNKKNIFKNFFQLLFQLHSPNQKTVFSFSQRIYYCPKLLFEFYIFPKIMTPYFPKFYIFFFRTGCVAL